MPDLREPTPVKNTPEAMGMTKPKEKPLEEPKSLQEKKLGINTVVCSLDIMGKGKVFLRYYEHLAVC